MKRMIKTLLISALCICMLLAAMPNLGSPVSAAEIVDSGYCGGEGDGTNLTWTLDSNGLFTISGTGDMGDYSFDGNYPYYTTAPWGGSVANAERIKTVVIESGVTSIGSYAFRGCKSVTSVSIGNSVISIKDYAFEDCTSLISITIPDSVTSIGYDAFYGCTSLISITIPDSVTSIGYYAFENCTSLISITVSNNNSDFSSKDGVLYNKDKTDLIRYPIKKTGSHYSIPDSVTRIRTSAFSDCTSLTSVAIPDSVTIIEMTAFSDCTSLTSVTIPDSVTSIGDGAFFDCTSLTSVTIPDSVTSIGNYAFQHCTSLTSVTIPDSVTSVEDFTFYNCSFLISATLPNNLNSIGTAAFYYCSNFTDVYFLGTQAEWDAITVGDRNDCLKNATIHYTQNVSYAVRYDANTGTNAPATQTKVHDVTLNLTSTIPTKTYSLTYNANGGSVSPASKTINAAFIEWNTKEDGSGTAYQPGENYSINNAVILYAQWTNPTVGNLPTPTRAGYGFDGWYTSASSGTKVTENTVITKDTTIYAHWIKVGATYTVSYNPNGGTGAPANQTKTEGTPLTLSSAKPTRSLTLNFNANGGSVSPASKTVDYAFKNWNTQQNGSGTAYAPGGSYTANADATLYAQWTNPTAGTLPTPTRDGYTFDGWYTAASGGTRITDASTITSNITLFAHWQQITVNYTVSYNANGGTGAPSAQTKTQNAALTLSTLVPTKSFTIRFNANGGSVSPASKTVSCTFRSWNTQQNGSGTSYSPGGSYTANADATLYAQWTNPTVGNLPTPTRDGYTFDGWYTAASGGTRVTASDTISDNTALFAHWESSPNVYNLGEETYSFSNFSDSHAGGHCFGMSMTSAGYYNQWIDMDRIGGSANTSLYSFSDTPIVRKPICYYQKKQGSYRERAMVAGGSFYRTGTNDIYSDWKAVVNYVKNHSYDNTGLLQIGFRKGEYGHAINFLRYENVNGQDRIYAYDNNFPKLETYFYRAADGNVYQTPMQTFSGSIDCICLRDISIYFNIVGDFNASHALYVAKDTATVQGYTFSYMEGAPGGVEYVMYEIPDSVSEVTIIPKTDNADFIYMDTEYSFGTVTDETYGVLTFASTDEHGVETPSSFKIYEGKASASSGDVDADGKVTASDARLALRCAVGLENYAPGSAQFLACDVDGDKKVTASDARLILRTAVGLETLK